MADPAVARTIAEARLAVRDARARGLTIGLVPTMGALHAGHARLVEACLAEAEFTAVSIFVNPTQFGPDEDFGRYPRSFDDDVRLCGLAGASLIFAPTAEEMYPTGRSSTYVEVPGLSEVLEGDSRPGHFRGVATVVMKLVQIVGPDLAFFGQKDFQQLAVIRRMARDLDVPVRVRSLATVREPDGLAMSSRNRYLGPEDRAAAVVLSRALGEAAEAVAAGEMSADRVRQILRSRIESEGRARLDYAEVASAITLEPLEVLSAEVRAVALLAAKVGPARLIDNALLPPPGSRSDAHLALEE